MGLFSFTKEIAIDLGTANTIIIHNDKIVIDEPSIVALEKRTGKLMAVGREAKLMQGKENDGIETIRPLRKGVIANFNAAEMMIRGLIKKASSKNNWFSPSMKMVVGIPSGSTEVEIRAVRDSSEHAGGRDVYMIYEPMAAALGIGIDVLAPQGNMIVDIGGGDCRDFTRRHRLQQEHPGGRRRPHRRHHGAHEPRPQRKGGRAHSRDDQDPRGFRPHRA